MRCRAGSRHGRRDSPLHQRRMQRISRWNHRPESTVAELLHRARSDLLDGGDAGRSHNRRSSAEGLRCISRSPPHCRAHARWGSCGRDPVPADTFPVGIWLAVSERVWTTVRRAKATTHQTEQTRGPRKMTPSHNLGNPYEPRCHPGDRRFGRSAPAAVRRRSEPGLPPTKRQPPYPIPRAFRSEGIFRI